jgi:hypothetical protein
MSSHEQTKDPRQALVAMLLAASWIAAPGSAEAALIEFDFITTVQSGADQLAGYSVGDIPILRGRVVFDTDAFESAMFGFQPTNWSAGGDLVLSSVSARGDHAVAQADFWLDDQLMWSGRDTSVTLGYGRQGREGGFDGGWSIGLDGFHFTSVDGGAPTGAVPLSEFGHSGDPLADFLLNFTEYGRYWMAHVDGFNRSLLGGHMSDPESSSIHRVPEPSTLGMFAFAILLMVGAKRMRAAR